MLRLRPALRTPWPAVVHPLRSFATSAVRLAVVDPFGATTAATAAPPPPPPAAAVEAARVVEDRAERIARRQRGMGKRFWGFTVVEEESEPAEPKAKTTRTAQSTETEPKARKQKKLKVLLDHRPIRDPGRRMVRLPGQKRRLGHALAMEWDQLRTIQQASQGHRMPLMSLVCRAMDLEEELESLSESTKSTTTTTTGESTESKATDKEATSTDQTTPKAEETKTTNQQGVSPTASDEAVSETTKASEAIYTNLLRYLDTDSLLCWAPPDSAARDMGNGHPVTLRQLQEQTAQPMMDFVQDLWKTDGLGPVLDGDSLFPKPHPPHVRHAAEQWLRSLDGWRLAGVERATLAGKSLVLGAAFVGGWTLGDGMAVDTAVDAANLETAFQTAQWGEVDDTHDVSRADLRRHFGSVVLLVAE